MEKTISIKILPDGDVVFLYNDDSPLRDLGDLDLQRASNVEWNSDKQKWVIWVNSPNGKKTLYSKSFTNRGDAIQEEIEMLNAALIDGVPAERLFASA